MLVARLPCLCRAAPLQDIVSRSLQEKLIPEESQLMAVICVKNCVQRRWVKRSQAQSLPDAEKAMVRQASLHLAGNTDGGLAAQLASLAAQIAKIDWPKAWPDLIPQCIQRLNEAFAAVQGIAVCPSIVCTARLSAALTVMHR